MAFESEIVNRGISISDFMSGRYFAGRIQLMTSDGDSIGPEFSPTRLHRAVLLETLKHLNESPASNQIRIRELYD